MGAAMPAMLLAGSMGMAAAGSGMQARGERQRAKSQAAMYEYNAGVQRREAAQIRRANLDEQRVRRDEMRRTLKQRRVLYAKASVTMAGSPMETQLQTAQELAEDIARLTETYDIEAQRAMSQAGLDVYRAKAAKKAGRLGVRTTLFGGISDIAKLGLKYELQKEGTV